jgi:hypothetical protein
VNRGYDGNDIFVGNKNKNQFLVYLDEADKKRIVSGTKETFKHFNASSPDFLDFKKRVEAGEFEYD